MRIVDRFPCRIREIEHATIAVRDGSRLAARLWLPVDVARVPAVLEYIPYRKRDGTRLRDEPIHRWFAGHGYAAVRVDVRGTGESEGILTDEYTAQEHDDALDVIAWIAAQPWCDGRVAMVGKSWGGFSALQVAALQPPALRAAIAVCASDDRYADDAHFMGGCLLNENLLWGSMLMALCAQPPAPEHCGPAWRDMWLQRLDAVRPFPAVWLGHPLRDDYWRHGSVADRIGDVRVPVFAIGGWADGYSNAVLRLLADLRSPRRGWIGPWGHCYPHEGSPGPAAGFLQRALAFLDACLGDGAAQAEAEPMLEAFLQASARPTTTVAERAGDWIAEPSWPSPNVTPRTLWFDAGGDRGRLATDRTPTAAVLWHEPSTTIGAAGGTWCAFGLEGEHPDDQAGDDARSLCFDGEVLSAPLAILGAPRVRLRLVADRPRAQLCVRLCEVFADGKSARVSFGLLELTHRHGHDRAVAVAPGVAFEIELPLNDTAHVFAVGSRIRIALSTDYWPMVWPMPEPVRLGIEVRDSWLALPERMRGEPTAPPPPPVAGPPPRYDDLDPGSVHRRGFVDAATGEHVVVTSLDLDDDGAPARTRFPDIGQVSAHGIRETFRIRPGDPLSASAETLHRTLSHSAGRDVTVELRTRQWADAESFWFTAELVARDRGEVIRERRWQERVARAALEADDPGPGPPV